MLGNVGEGDGQFFGIQFAVECFGAEFPRIELRDLQGRFAVARNEVVRFEELADFAHALTPAAQNPPQSSVAATQLIGRRSLFVGFGGVEHTNAEGDDTAALFGVADESPAARRNSEIDPQDQIFVFDWRDFGYPVFAHGPR